MSNCSAALRATPSGNGEGQSFLGFVTVTTDGSGNGSFPLFVTPGGGFITATATDPGNNTSEFSACVNVAATFGPVTTANDSGPGSLRQAIIDANAIPGPNTITFAIPGSGVADHHAAVATADDHRSADNRRLDAAGISPDRRSSRSTAPAPAATATG